MNNISFDLWVLIPELIIAILSIMGGLMLSLLLIQIQVKRGILPPVLEKLGFTLPAKWQKKENQTEVKHEIG